MAYQSLYRRYRPQRFAEVRGQEHLVRALRNAVAEERVGHAYLFSGPRGTGKTTTARILAKALNCPDLRDGEPCGVCDSCLAIEHGRSFDLQELDAASNRGINEMKDLLDTIALGTPGRRKVYILDEVHMLTPQASAALLKSLEEPPEHVVFVLATTDPQKVLPTIRSRTQHFELHLLPAAELRALVDEVVADAGLDVGEEQIEYALRKGGGSARDTLSALDQVAASGAAPATDDAVDRLVDGIADADPGAALAGVQQALTVGWEPRLIGEQLLANLRDAFLVAMQVDLPQASEAARARARSLADRLGPRSLTRALEVLGEALVEMRQAADPRIPLEVALLRLARPDLDDTLAAVHDRLDRLERQVAAGGGSGGAPEAPAERSTPSDRSESTPPAGSSTAAPPRSGSAAPARSASGSTAAAADGGAGRPADGARRVLADRRSEPAAPAPEVAPGAPARPTLGAHRRSRRRDVAPAAADAPTAPEPSPPAPEPAGDESPAGPPEHPGGGALPTRDELTLAWGDRILPGLSQRTRSRWAPGRFLDVGAEGARYGLPNQITCDRCADQRAEVEQALAAHFGVAVPVVLVVDDRSAPPPDVLAAAALGRSDGGDEIDPDALLAEVGPVEELEDAGGVGDGLSRITDAFPGSEVIEVEEP